MMERERLLSSTRKYKSALEDQVSDLKDNAKKWAIQGLVFGGVALATFLVVKAFQKKPKKTTKDELAKTSYSSAIFTSIQSYILSFVLALAREKITEYLENYFSKYNEPSHKNKGKAAEQF